MLDMGPYYLTALVNLMGPMKRVAGISRITFPTRLITSQPKYGKVIQVETPTHITGAIEFQQGAIATVIMSSDVWAHRLPLYRDLRHRGFAGRALTPTASGNRKRCARKTAQSGGSASHAPLRGAEPHSGAGRHDPGGFRRAPPSRQRGAGHTMCWTPCWRSTNRPRRGTPMAGKHLRPA